MSWIAQRPSSFVGQVVGNGQCVAYVQRSSRAPQTALWRRGELVKSGNIPQGIAIETFGPLGFTAIMLMADPTQPLSMSNFPRGYLSGTKWFNHPVEPRVIRFRSGDSAPANDGDEFYVIEHA